MCSLSQTILRRWHMPSCVPTNLQKLLLISCGITIFAYGFPKRLHSDQGANFESALIAEFLSVAGVQKSHTTPYHPMGIGSCERMNRT